MHSHFSAVTNDIASIVGAVRYISTSTWGNAFSARHSYWFTYYIELKIIFNLWFTENEEWNQFTSCRSNRFWWYMRRPYRQCIVYYTWIFKFVWWWRHNDGIMETLKISPKSNEFSFVPEWIQIFMSPLIVWIQSLHSNETKESQSNVDKEDVSAVIFRESFRIRINAK